jgi:peptidase E
MKKIIMGMVVTGITAGIAYAVKQNGGVASSVDKLKKHPTVLAAVDMFAELKTNPTVTSAIDALKQGFVANDVEFTGGDAEQTQAAAA